MTKHIGQKIKVLRAQKNLSQRDLAALLKTGQNNISFWEQGKQRVSADTLIKICEIFELSLGQAGTLPPT